MKKFNKIEPITYEFEAESKDPFYSTKVINFDELDIVLKVSKK